jgi:hypothetical protein
MEAKKMSRLVEISMVIAAPLQNLERIWGLKIDFHQAASQKENLMKVIFRCP